MLRRFARWLGYAVLLAAVAGYLVINFAPHDPTLSMIDPTTTDRSGTANDFLAAPPDTTRARADREIKVYPESPEDLLARFRAITVAAPRVEIFENSNETGRLNLAQRSAIIGYPDYVAVKAVQVEGGSALIVYSRSRYGRDDFGVNRARVEAWLAALE